MSVRSLSIGKWWLSLWPTDESPSICGVLFFPVSAGVMSKWILWPNIQRKINDYRWNWLNETETAYAIGAVKDNGMKIFSIITLTRYVRSLHALAPGHIAELLLPYEPEWSLGASGRDLLAVSKSLKTKTRPGFCSQGFSVLELLARRSEAAESDMF